MKDNPWRYAALGTQWAVSVLLGMAVGYWADGRFGTRPWGLVGGAALGAAVGFYQFLIQTLRRKQP